MHRWLLTLQNMACSTFRVGCSQNWIRVFFWQFKIFSMFIQVNECFKSRNQESLLICEPPPSMFPELLQCHWWRSRPRPRSNHRLQHAENTAELSRSVQQNYPQSENTAVLQWRLVTTRWLVFCAGWFIFGFWDIASEMEWLEGEGPLSILIQNEMNIFGFDMDLRFIFAEESIQKQVKSKKADLLCLNRIETDEHL